MRSCLEEGRVAVMAANVERVESEVLEKNEVGNEERRSELDTKADQVLIDQNGECKNDGDGEGDGEGDGSYVFVAENDAVSVDSGSDGVVETNVGVSASEEFVRVEEESVAGGKGKIDNGGSGDGSVEEVVRECAVEPKGDMGDDGVVIEEETGDSNVVDPTADERELPQVGENKIENEEVIELESGEPREESKNSEIATGNPPEFEIPQPIKSDTATDLEGNRDSESMVAEDDQCDADQGNQHACLDQGREAVEVVSSEIPLDGLYGDVRKVSEHKLENDSTDVQLESEAVSIPLSDKNGDLQLKYEVVRGPVSDERDDAELEFEAAKVHASHEDIDVELEPQAVGLPADTENANDPDSEAMIASSNENSDVPSESEAVRVATSNERDHVQLESETVDNTASSGSIVDLAAAPAQDGDSGTGVVNSLVDANSKVPEQNLSSGQAEGSSFDHPIETTEFSATPEVNDKRSILTNEITDNGLTEDARLDKNQTSKEEPTSPSETEVAYNKEKGPTTGHDQETVTETKTESNTDAGSEAVEEAKSFPPTGAHRNLLVESGKTSPAPIDNEVAGSGPETMASKIVENSTAATSDVVRREIEVVQSDAKHDQSVYSPATDSSEVGIEVSDGPKNNATESTSLSATSKNVATESRKAFPTPMDHAAPESDHETKASNNVGIGADGDLHIESKSAQLVSECSQTADCLLVENGKVEIGITDGTKDIQTEKNLLPASVSESEMSANGIESEEGKPLKTDTEAQFSEGFNICAGKTYAETVVETSKIENERSSTSLGDVTNTKSEVKSVSSSRTILYDVPAAEAELQNGSAVESEESSFTDAVNVVDGKAQSDDEEKDDKVACQEIDGIDISPINENPASPPEASLADDSEGHNVVAEPEKRPFYYLIRVPRYDDEKLKEQIKHAQSQVDKKTESRDAIKTEIQTVRVSCKEYADSLEAALAEERSARDLLRLKRQEIDSYQSRINVVKSVTSVEDLDGRVRSMEHMIEHETLPLKEEKQLIREIKQLKQLRQQILSNMGTQEEVQGALDQKDEIEERLKVLKKEASLIRDNVLKTEAVTKAARKKYYDESDKLSQLQDWFKAADAVRQEAFACLQSLRKQSYQKNKHFYNQRDEAKAANDLALKGDKEGLQRLCINQVETFMNLWNKDDEFRRDYVRCNIRSTLWRLRTLDGRALGPDEEPPVVPRPSSERVEKSVTVSSVPTHGGEKQEHLLPVEDPKLEGKPVTKSGEQKNQSTKSNEAVKSTPLASNPGTVSSLEEVEEVIAEECKLTKEEEEKARKTEELRKQENAERLKEERRLEEIAKAKEALERKKRIAEKAKARAALKAQKEAEEKEKEREKRLRKKERRKGATAADVTNVGNEEQPALSPETQAEPPKEAETTKEKPVTVTKRTYKPQLFVKQSKLKPIPMPLRNRGKRKMQQWMWVVATAVAFLALFLLGNSEFSLTSVLRVFRL